MGGFGSVDTCGAGPVQPELVTLQGSDKVAVCKWRTGDAKTQRR